MEQTACACQHRSRCICPYHQCFPGMACASTGSTRDFRCCRCNCCCALIPCMLPSVLQQKVCEVSTRLQNLFASCAGCRANVYELQPQAKAMRLVQRCVPVQQLPLPQHPHPLLKLHRRRPCGIAVLLRMGRGLHNRSLAHALRHAVVLPTLVQGRRCWLSRARRLLSASSISAE